MRRFAAWLVPLALLALPAPALAADTVVGFDDLPPDTRVVDQYQGQGLRLSRDSTGFLQTEEHRTRTKASGGNALEVSHSCGPHGDGEFPCSQASDYSLHGRLDFARQRVAITVVDQDVGPTSLIARAPNGDVVASASVPHGTAVPFTIEATSPAQNIVFFELQGAYRIDDVTYDNPASPPPPDFSIGVQFSPFQDPQGIPVKAGAQVTLPVLVNRFNSSQGPITVTPLMDTTTGVQSGGAQTTSGPDGTLLNFTFKVPASAPPQMLAVTLRGTAGSIAAGPPAAQRNVSFNLRIFRDYDLQVTGIEVTQGIQRELIRCMTPSSCDENFSLPFRNPADPNASVPYNGTFPIPYTSSTMVAGKRTVARVFANVRDPAFPDGIAVERVAMRLRGFGVKGELKEGPLAAEQGPGQVRSGGPGFTTGGSGKPFVTFKDRVDPKGPFTFTLPDSWTRERFLSLRAELVPPDDLDLGGQQGSKECPTAACKANNAFTLSGIPFFRVGSTRVAFAWLYVDGDSRHGPRDSAGVPVIARELVPYSELVIPFGEGDLRTSTDFFASVNVQEALDEEPDDDRAAMYEAKDILEDYASDYPGCSYLDFCAEIISGIMSPRITTRGVSDAEYPGVNVAPVGRTPTIAHEISHNLGREHSGEDCPGIGENGQTAEDWPPDERGLIHGIGLDTRPNSGGPLVYRVIAPANLGAPDSPGARLPDFPLQRPSPTVVAQTEWFDQQSYCRVGDRDRWTSVLGLERYFVPTLGFGPDFVPPTKNLGALSLKARRAAPRRLLHVQAVAGQGVTPEVTVVKERTLRPRAMPASSPYHLVVRNAAGAVLADVPMQQSNYPPDPQVQLTGQAQVRGAASVEVTLDGASIARRARSAAAPSVRISAPRRGQRAGARRDVDVRWAARDTDGDRLRAKVDYSFDDGRNWTVLFVGKDTGRARIPSAYLSRSRRARVRVRVSDGFNEGQATSARFVAVGRPPSVRIASPARRGQRIAQDAWLVLTGDAADDRRRRLAGRALRWYEGRRLVARGARASITGLRLGRRSIRLTARDAFGRRRSTFATITVVAVPPQFLRLSAPRRLGRRARTVTLRVRTNVPATLTASGRRYRVGRRTRRVRVPIRAGRRKLVLPVRLRSGRFTARRTLEIARS